MKTDDIYFADVSIITSKERLDTYTLSPRYGIRIYDYKIYYQILKKILILYKEDKYGDGFAIDLNTNRKLKFGPSKLKIGDVFINVDTLDPFNVITGNEKVNLTKRKILKLGNPILNETNKRE